MEPLDLKEELLKSGPKNYYEMAVLTMDRDKALEFLLLEVQSKDRLIQLLAKIIHQEIGERWWQMYADHLGEIPSVNPQIYPVEAEAEEDIPL